MAAQALGALILWLIIAVYVLRWLYRRLTKDTAFVIPVLHETTPVNMNVMRICADHHRTRLG